MRTFDNRNGDRIIKTVSKYEPSGIRKRRLRLKAEMYSKTFDRWIERLINLKILKTDNQRYIHLTKAAKIERRRTGTIVILEDSRKKKKKRTIIIGEVKRNHRTITERKQLAYAILIFKAAFGDYRYRSTPNPLRGDTAMIDIKTGKNVNYSGYVIPGVGVSDFRKTKGHAMLNRRKHVGLSEFFAYMNFSESEIQKYIDELKNHNPPVIKEITISDHKFSYCTFDIDTNNDNPNLISMNRGDDYNTTVEPKYRLILGQEEGCNKLRFYHDVFFNEKTPNNIKISSKLVLDINNETARKLLGLDEIYKNNNNFSKSLWREKRYIIAEPLLQEFIEQCWFILNDVRFIMDEIYVYKLWPKVKMDINPNSSRKSLTIYRSFIKWYKVLFGNYRFTQHHFNTLLRRNENLEGSRKFKKYLKKMLHKPDLTYCSSDDVINSYKKITEMEQKDLEFAKSLIDMYTNAMLHRYKIIKNEKKYVAIHNKYSEIVTPLLDLVYPIFIIKIVDILVSRRNGWMNSSRKR